MSDDPEVRRQIEVGGEFLDKPNNNGGSFRTVFWPFMKDVLEIDQGVMFKSKVDGKLTELYTYDGSSFLISITPHGILKKYYQYSFRFPVSKPLEFELDEIIFGVFNKVTEFTPYGFSSLQSVQQEVELMIQATRWNKEFFQNNARPDLMITVPMKEDQMKRFQSYWEQSVRGKPHKTLFHNVEGTDIKFMSMTNKDMEWLEGQKWYFHLIFGAYGLSPQEAGFYEESNKSTSESQERVSARNASRPYMDFLAERINMDIFPDLFEVPLVKFRFVPKDDSKDAEEHKQHLEKLREGVYTINEVRAMEGLEPVEWGDEPVKQSSPLDQNDEEDGDDKKDDGEDDDSPPQDSKKKLSSFPDLIKKMDFTEKDDAENYADFLESKFSKWEKIILKAVELYLPDAINKGYVRKEFSEFIVVLMNSINSVVFTKGLKGIIASDIQKGYNIAEIELDMNIESGREFTDLINMEFDKQLNGYTINGKVWSGLKGVSTKLQHKIIHQVNEDLRNRKSINQIKDNIKDIFTREKGGEIKGEVTEGRTMRIARTETNRLKESGKLMALQKSGLDLTKEWVTKIDKKTSDVCKRLDGQIVKLNAPFRDPVSKKEFMTPPAHPNCRSSFKPKLVE